MKNNVDLSPIDLLALVSRYTQVVKKVTNGRDGEEYKGPCPVCDGRDRFTVWPLHTTAGKGRWYCRRCNQSGDAGDFLTFIQPGISENEKWAALKALGATFEGDEQYTGAGQLPGQANKVFRPPPDCQPPTAAWQTRARACLAYAQEQLWKDTSALAYLTGRGMTLEMIREAGLGYVPQSITDHAERWGLNSKEGPVWISRGWIIPWEIDGQLWRLNIRRHPEEIQEAQAKEDARAATEGRDPKKVNKYTGPRGWGGGKPLYRGNRISMQLPVVMVEGEFKAFAIIQAAGDIVEVVATGSTTGARAARWIGLLGAAPLVLLAFDNDENHAGDEAAAWWRDGLKKNSLRLRPLWADPDQMAQDGLDLRPWIQGVLEMANWKPARRASLAKKAAQVQTRMEPPVELWRDPYGIQPTNWPATVILPGDWRGIVTPAKWERRPDGSVQATFDSLEEWKDCQGAARAIAESMAEEHYQAGPGDDPARWWTEYRKIALLAGWSDVGE